MALRNSLTAELCRLGLLFLFYYKTCLRSAKYYEKIYNKYNIAVEK